MEPRPPARARGRAPRSTCSTSAPTPATWIEASSTTRRSPVRDPWIRGGRARHFRSRRIIQNDLIADYDAVSVILRKRMSHGLQVDAHYTWSRTRDMATHSNGGGQTMNNYDIRADYGPANWDIPHRFVASYIYDMPFLKNSSQPVLKYVVAGWQIGGVTTIQSGSPVNVTHQRRPREHRHLGPPAAGSGRLGADAQLPADRRTAVDLVNCFDASAFALPAQFTFGNAPRNVLRGPKSVITDLSLVKNVPARRQRAVPDPRGDLQRVQHRQLWQPERRVRLRDVRPYQLRGQHAARCNWARASASEW